MNRRHMSGFTLIELLVVLAILATIFGLTSIGLGGILPRARVERSVSSFIQATGIAQQMAMADRRVYTITINSSLPPGSGPNQVPMGVTPSERDFCDFSDMMSSGSFNHTMTTPAPWWSDKPADQWFAIMAPWQDSNGGWWQARGGMPRRDPATNRRIGVPGSSDSGSDQVGGCFGPVAGDTTTAMTGTNNTWDNGRYTTVRLHLDPSWDSAWTWDPYGAQVGPRRFLARGTRWTAMFDCPEWAALGGNSGNGDPSTVDHRNAGLLTAAFLNCLPAHLTTGRTNTWNEWQITCNFNFYPSGAIDRNQCTNVQAYSSAGGNFDQRSQGWIGICSTTTAPATFQPYNTSDGSDDLTKPALAYRRPVFMRWITLFSSGVVISGPSPRFLP